MTPHAYYNDNDPGAAAWLRELMAAGLIMKGTIDERSITEVTPDDLKGFIRVHWFSGIAGWDLALQLAGWPADRPVWTASLPCPSFSCAGKGDGFADPRGRLWRPFARIVRECRPGTLFGEQVEAAIGHGWLDRIFSDLEDAGYACAAAVLPACAVGAPHRRQRLFWVAHAHQLRFQPVCKGIGGQTLRRQSQGDGGQRRTIQESARGCGVGSAADGWTRVVFASDCTFDPDDTDREFPTCPVCGGEYGGWGCGPECRCPGPTEDGWEYEPGERADGFLYARRLADVQCAGLEGLSGDERDGDQPGRLETDPAGSVAEGGPTGGVGDATGGGCRVGGDAALAGSRGYTQRTVGAGPGFCSNFTTILCRDGKTRRAECQSPEVDDGVPALLDALRRAGASEAEIAAALETFPVTQNQPGRVSLLRGYGNSIVVPLAAEFIRAAAEAIAPCSPTPASAAAP